MLAEVMTLSFMELALQAALWPVLEGRLT